MPVVRNYIAREKKWKTVVIFETLPRDHPRKSKEGREVAKFTALGDAYNYILNDLTKGPCAAEWAMIAIR